MNNISANTFRQWAIVALLSIVAFFAQGIYGQVKDIECRLRIVERNQAAIMARLNVEQPSNPAYSLH
jgi:hypothetical protein